MIKLRKILSILLICLLLASCTSQSPIDYGDEPPPTPDAGPSPSPTLPPSPTPGDPTPETPSPPPIELEEYTGTLYHVFYHFLMAYPDVAYSNSYGKNLDNDCVGPTEFWRSLEELHKNDFVLVNLNDYNEVLPDGTIAAKPIMVPVGKKPVVMSFDDINYYSNTTQKTESLPYGHGICDKIILDEDGKLAMLTVMYDGSELVTYDNDVVPLLEAFCEQYPDFSPFGVKGLLSITGYDGILGYRTQSGSPDRESEIEAVKPVVQALLDAGWYFGSHSYSHFWMDSDKVSADRVGEDTRKWRDEVGSLVGDTRIYLFPYGDWPDHSGSKFKHLLDNGFNLLCGVGMPPYYKQYERYVFMDRQYVDGRSLRNHQKWLEPLMDPFTVYCTEERNNVPLTAPVRSGAVNYNNDSVYRDRFSITIALGGDVMLAGTMGTLLKNNGPDAIISPELAALFRYADISMINLESAVSDLGAPWPEKDYAFRAEPSILDFLRDTLNIGVVSLANNHTIDYGFDAFYDTMDRLDSHGIGYVGGGMNLEEAMKPYVMEVHGFTVAFLAASQVAPNMDWYAGNSSSGLLMAYDPALIIKAVEGARELYDYVIVYMHWGKEHQNETVPMQVNAARAMIDAGADAIIGSHSHCIQSFEVYNGKPIIYSLSNFLMLNHYNHTAAALLHLQDGKAELEIVPCRVSGRVYTELADAVQARELRAFFQRISPNGVIGEDWILR